MHQIELEPVAPVRPAAPYLGGKKLLARRLVAMISATHHDLYAEPFVGMGGVFLRRTSRPKAEVINDRSRDVATFFRILQRHYQAFMDMLKWQLTSRAEFERLIATAPDTLTDLERAARFLYLQKLAFGGKPVGQNFGVETTRPARFDTTKLGLQLEAIHDRLARVTIECLDWSKFIDRWDRPNALFFVDPPYIGNESDYGAGLFSKDDQTALKDRLRALRGRFILTLNDCPQARELYRDFKIERMELTYSVAGPGRHKLVGEIVVSNF